MLPGKATVEAWSNPDTTMRQYLLLLLTVF
jgi:hypothetical protein